MSGTQSGAVDGVVAEIDDETITQAKQSGIDVENVILETIDQYSDSLASSTIAKFAASEIERQIETEDHVQVRGLVAGSRDRTGKNWPRRYSVLRKQEGPVEVSSWDGSLPGPGGSEMQIPPLGVVTFNCEYDEEYDSHEAKGVEDVQELDPQTAAEELSSVAVSPSEIGQRDEYSVVAVKGEIKFVNTQTIFRDGQPHAEGEVKVRDERGTLRPHMEIGLSVDGENALVRAHLEEQRYGQPAFSITDAEPILEMAVDKHDSPEQQADFVDRAFTGTEAIVVGNVNSVDRVRGEDGTDTYIDIATSAVIENYGGSDDAAASEPADDAGRGEPESESNTPDQTASDSAPADAPTDGSESDETKSQVEQVADDVETYAQLTGTDRDDLTVSLCKDNLDIDAPEAVIEAAINRLQDGGDDETAKPETDDKGRPLSLKNDDGTWVCPSGDLFSGSWAALLGHVQSEHGADDPKDWLASEAGGDN